MIARATTAGLRAAGGNKRLAATLWLLNLALALAAGIPGWTAISAAIGPLPGADSLAEAFSFGVLGDLTELAPGLVPGLGNAASAIFGLGLLVGLVATGGALEVLTSRDERSFAHRFGRGAFRFFGRFLRLGALTLVAAVLLCGLVAGPLFALSGYLRRESGSEALSLWLMLAGLVAGGLVLLLVMLVQDAARVRIVREDSRRVLRALRVALPTVLRHPAAWLGAWAWNAALLLAAFAAYLALANAIPAGKALLALVVLQQLFVLLRCGLRVALIGAEIELVDAFGPPPPPPAQTGVELPPEPVPSPELGTAPAPAPPAEPEGTASAEPPKAPPVEPA